MKKIFLIIALLALGFGAEVKGQVGELPRSTPEAQGVQSGRIRMMLDSLMNYPNTEIHSFMMLRHGKVIAELYPTPFNAEGQHILASCSKTFVSAAVGLCVDDNRLQVTDRVLNFFPEHSPDSISENLASLTVHHLLTMGSGITPDWVLRDTSTTWIKSWLAKPIDKPGGKFLYDSMSTYMLSAIVQRVAGVTVFDLLKERIFGPLGIATVDWEISPEGYNTGGWGLNLQAESMAKFGQLLLQRGQWNGEQLISTEWIDEMMKSHVQHQNGYGYQMWGCEHPGAWRADGAFGQYIVVAPKEDVVIVVTQCMRDHPVKEREIIWRHALNGLSDKPLQTDRNHELLTRDCARYHLDWPTGNRGSSTLDKGHFARIALEKNRLGWKSLTITNDDGKYTVRVEKENGERVTAKLGYKEWLNSTSRFTPPYNVNAVDRFKGITRSFDVAGAMAWPSKYKMEFILQWTNWISMVKVGVTFGAAGQATVEMTYNLESYSTPFKVMGKYERFRSQK